MFRRPGTGRSRASADTLCQKCLNRGHYSYECTVTAQQRPYKSRPSRTQQLLNPQLKPKLTTEVPLDLPRKKGLADEILAKKEEARGRKARRDSSRKRSVSPYSSDSVSTISTNRSPARSPSRSPPPKSVGNGKQPRDMLGKRGRRSVSSESDRSMGRAERRTRRRLSSFSPEQRGRRRSRSQSSRMDTSHDGGSRRPHKHRSRSRNMRKRGGRRSRSRSEESHGKRPVRNFSVSRSPSRSPNRMDISEDHPVSRNGASPSPFRRSRPTRSPSPYRNPKNGTRHQFDDRQPPPTRNQPPPSKPVAPRERSLSPYSKRVALTKQMQVGR
ncbi:hypothetical protein P280DRAFT_474010 [Massarina eburnea CBS 473.64]|uniref:Zinc knuckle-domain-containing protein n=1 Tax=Massarina eburnea CBS 473.64 TaxID=1395130 RepID=A0A6A6RM02_9PLEO|nr:hypothetical protein P280DRAFT_474010 [Massarina eburnea CBS 473.64]